MAANPAIRVNEAALDNRDGNDKHLSALKATMPEFQSLRIVDRGTLPHDVQRRLPR